MIMFSLEAKMFLVWIILNMLFQWGVFDGDEQAILIFQLMTIVWSARVIYLVIELHARLAKAEAEMEEF